MSKIEELTKPFEDSEIEWRVGSTTKDKKKGMMLAYVTNRAIMNRLDEVLGWENWRVEFRELHKGVICTMSIRLGEDKDWVTKEDGADLTNIEATKGGISDAMKRAAVQFGIGRYLYEAQSVWVELNDSGYPKEKPKSVTFKTTKSKKPWSEILPDYNSEVNEQSSIAPEPVENTLEASLHHVSQAKDLNDLTKRFRELSATMRKDNEVIAKCTEVKNKLNS